MTTEIHRPTIKPERHVKGIPDTQVISTLAHFRGSLTTSVRGLSNNQLRFEHKQLLLPHKSRVTREREWEKYFAINRQ